MYVATVLRAFAVAAVGLAAAMTAMADEYTIRIGAGHPSTGFAYVQAAESHFIPEVVKEAKKKGHDIRFIRAWAGSVAKVDGIIDAVQKGVLDIGLSNPTF